ncbi:MAG: UbiD family decarboxylase [Anaerolineae bacterium]|nr:UbiD family decarboxylase [Anaerolineae bacterium]
MDLRALLEELRQRGELAIVRRPVAVEREAAAVISALDGRPVLFEDCQPGAWLVAANLVARKQTVALGLGTSPDQLLGRLVEAFRNPRPPRRVTAPPCQEVVEPAVDLERLPILTHGPRDAGPYVTAGVLILSDPDTGPNVAFHRLLRLDGRRFAARLVEGRGTHTAWAKASGDLPVAVCLGVPVQVLVAAAMSPPAGVDELHIAEALAPTPVVRCQTVPLDVPASSEMVLEGRLTHELAPEGPFIDLTGTYDIVRQQPVLVVDRITHRRDPIYQALLPGGPEHGTLMGMPREPSIYDAVAQVCRVLQVQVTPGGASWLHAVVQIEKQRPDDGRRAIDAAFRGHGSLKHVVVVDADVDPLDPPQVEWAIATRVQADRDVVILPAQPGSSLDPSALLRPGQKATTAKMGVDATIPWDTPSGPSDPESFARIAYPAVDLRTLLET